MTRYQAASKRAVRLTFTYEGEKISLVDRQPLEKRVRPSDPILKEGEAGRYSGFWIELRDGYGNTLYRHVMHDPLQMSVEVPADDPNQSFTRHRVKNPTGTFSVILPDLEPATSLVIFNSPPDPDEKGRMGAREIARFDYRQNQPEQKEQ